MIPVKDVRFISAFALLTMALSAQAQTKRSIDVNEPRPLWSALDQLETVNPGVAINYEDPPYENVADTQDSATPQQQIAHPGFHLIVPRAGEVRAEVAVSSTPEESAANVLGNLNLLLANYRQNKLPGDFRIEQANNAIYVTPISVLGVNGSSREVASPMTTLISVPEAKRSVAEAARAIFDAVSKATGLKFGIASFPFRPTEEVTFGASNEPARDALAKLFGLAGKTPVSYRLLFEPKPDTRRVFDYMVNIHFAGYVPPQTPPGPGTMGPMEPSWLTGPRPGGVPVK